MKEFLGLIVEHLRVNFDNLSCIGFWDIVRKIRHTNKRRWKPHPRDCRRRA